MAMQAGVSRLKELLFDSEHEQLNRLQTRVEQLATTEPEKRRELGELLARELYDHVDRGLAQHSQQLQQLKTSAAAEAELKREIGQRLDQVFQKVGDDDRLRLSVTGIIDGALRDAEVQKHDKMSRAIAPLVVKTIKTELNNNRDEMVEALYPLTGRMVKSYVNAEIKRLKAEINQDLERRITSNPLMLMFKGRAAGRTAGDIALADSQRLTVEEVYLIRRGSGELVQRWPQSTNGGGLSNSDIHMSGVITAVNEFASHALKDDGNLRGFELDDCHIYLRASPVYLLAAKCRGVPPVGIEAKLDEEFVNVIERNRQIMDNVGTALPDKLNSSLLEPLANALTASVDEFDAPIATAERAGINPLKILSWIIALPILGYAAWVGWTAYETNRVRTQVTDTIAATPEMSGYPITLDVSPRGRIVTLSGLAPNAIVKTQLSDRLSRELAGTDFHDRLAVLPSVDPTPQISAVRQELTSLEQEFNRRIVRRSVDRASQRLAETGPDLIRLEQVLPDDRNRATVRATASVLQQSAAELANPQLDLEKGIPAITAKLAAAADTLAAMMQAQGTPRAPATPQRPAANLAATAENLSAAAERLAAVTLAVTQSAQIKPVVITPPVIISAKDRLTAWIRDNAIFFTEGTEYRSADAASKAMDTLAKLIIDAKTFVRVVGYTDSAGAGGQRNGPISQARAEKVSSALIERGVPRDLIGTIGRANGSDISTATGAQSPNRRVEFEIGFNGEGG
jgi:outer membrane protein OmpA-like peptidoglycan-associated protein